MTGPAALTAGFTPLGPRVAPAVAASPLPPGASAAGGFAYAFKAAAGGQAALTLKLHAGPQSSAPASPAPARAPAAAPSASAPKVFLPHVRALGSPVPPRRVAVERRRREIAAAVSEGEAGSGGGLERLLIAEGINYRAVSGGDVQSAKSGMTISATLPLSAFDSDETDPYTPAEWVLRGVVDGEVRGVSALALDEAPDGTGVWRAATVLSYDAGSALFDVVFDAYVPPPTVAAPTPSRARAAITSSLALASSLASSSLSSPRGSGGASVGYAFAIERKDDERKSGEEKLTVRGGPTAAVGAHASLPRTSVCFLAESPSTFASRLGAAFAARRAAAAELRFALAVDSMPTSDSPPLSNDMRERILASASAARTLRIASRVGSSASAGGVGADAGAATLPPALAAIATTLLNGVQTDWARAMNRAVLVSAVRGGSTAPIRRSTRSPTSSGFPAVGAGALLSSLARPSDATEGGASTAPSAPLLTKEPTRALVPVAGGAYGAADYEAAVNAFKFRSLQTMPPVVSVRQAAAAEMSMIWPRSYGGGAGLGLLVSHGGVKSFKLDEFEHANKTAIEAYVVHLKEAWAATTRNHVRLGLSGVGKGNFNLKETSEVGYATSKLRRLLRAIGYHMADELYSAITAQIVDFTASVELSCSATVTVNAPNAITSTFPANSAAARRAPLFSVDCVVIEETLPPLPVPPPDPKAKKPAKDAPPPPPPQPRILHSLGLSSAPHALAGAPPTSFANGLASIKGAVTTVERQVMDRLFWPTEPRIQTVQAGEALPASLEERLQTALSSAIKPLDILVGKLAPIVNPVLELNAEALVTGLREKYAEAGGESGPAFNLAECAALVKKHREAAVSILDAVPATMVLGGIVAVNATELRAALVKRHTDCADAVVQLMAQSAFDASTGVLKGYEQMIKTLSAPTSDIESLTQVKEFIASLPDRLKDAAGKYESNMPMYNALETARYIASKEQFDMQWKAMAGAAKVWKKVAEVEKALEDEKNRYQEQLAAEQLDFEDELANLSERCSQLNRFNKLDHCTDAARECILIRDALKVADEKARLFNSREALFGKDLTEYERVSEIKKAFDPYITLWESAQSWQTLHGSWMSVPFVTLDAEGIERDASNVSRAMFKSIKTFERLAMDGCTSVAKAIKTECDEFMPLTPLITALRNPGMRTRHWADLSEVIGAKVDPDGEGDAFTLPRVIELNLAKYMEQITKVGERAGKEYQIEVALDKMSAEWADLCLEIVAYRETGTFVLRGVDDLQALLDEHTTMTQAMAFSAFKKPFAERIDQWAATLMLVSEVLDEWLKVQRSWMYLEPIFSSADIQKQLPTEYKRFAGVDKNWRTTLTAARGGAGAHPTPQKAIQFCANPKLLERWQEGNRFLELVQKGLSDYLETKRAGFGRFYFLSNDELLEILSQTKDPRAVQPHLKKCFEGVRSVEFESATVPIILAIISGEKEKVALNEFAVVDPRGKNVEVWMTETEQAMCRSMRTVMKSSVDEYVVVPRTQWVQNWPGQCVLNASQLHWTREMEDFIREKGNEGVKLYYEQQVSQLKDMVVLIRGRLNALARITLGSLTVIDVHARDVTKKMWQAGVASINDFDWISQLRYYWIDGPSIDAVEGNMSVCMISSRRPYGYEYLGNTLRLVITPLTDKCASIFCAPWCRVR